MIPLSYLSHFSPVRSPIRSQSCPPTTSRPLAVCRDALPSFTRRRHTTDAPSPRAHLTRARATSIRAAPARATHGTLRCPAPESARSASPPPVPLGLTTAPDTTTAPLRGRLVSGAAGSVVGGDATIQKQRAGCYPDPRAVLFLSKSRFTHPSGGPPSRPA
jgi:hypothetical protein